MLRHLLLGLAKGAVIGGGLGAAAWGLGLTGAWGYLVYGLVGVTAGLLVGRPLWAHLRDRRATVFTSVLKGLVGVVLALGVFALVRHAAGDPRLALLGERRGVTSWPMLFGPALGAALGAWFECDDA